MKIIPIQNGVLRGHKRPPYNLIKPFGLKDKRIEVVLRAPDPLVHFSLVSGSRSSPAIRCYSPGSIDEELRLAGRIFFDDEHKDGNMKYRGYGIYFGCNFCALYDYKACYDEDSDCYGVEFIIIFR
jgi:hypothetical protein